MIAELYLMPYWYRCRSDAGRGTSGRVHIATLTNPNRNEATAASPGYIVWDSIAV